MRLAILIATLAFLTGDVAANLSIYCERNSDGIALYGGLAEY